jgi:hypothetical protein
MAWISKKWFFLFKTPRQKIPQSFNATEVDHHSDELFLCEGGRVTHSSN